MKTKLNNSLIAFMFFAIPNLNFGQSPNLGTATNFALFTSVGAFDNVGATHVTGDIGTNLGAFSGFPPGIVVGQIDIADPISAQAAIDVNLAYTDLNGIACDSVIGTSLGSNQVLFPNVYCLGGISVLNGDLILDGQGNPNALFIFKVDGALSTSAFSNIILIDSASLCNVYWQINGAVELGDSSIFKGNIIANGAINLLESAYLLGRGLSRQGAISLNSNMVAVGMLSIDPLAIELINFSAKPFGSSVQVDWSTASETSNDYVIVQHSKDGIIFEEVQKIHGAGNSDIVLHYTVIDSNPYDDVSYYRLKQTDFDGKFTYSNLVGVNFKKPLEYIIYPNPFSLSINIIINLESQSNNVGFSLYNVLGEEVMNITIVGKTTTLETINLQPGIYFYKVVCNNKLIQSGKLVSKQ